MSYTHLTQDERYQIHILNKAGHNQSEIACVMECDKSPISRKLKRNCGQRGYRPRQAQALSPTRGLLPWLGSPTGGAQRPQGQQAVGRQPRKLYQRIYADKRAGSIRHPALRCQKARKKCCGGRERRGAIPNQVSIEQCPAIVDKRKRYGDWEGDLVIGAVG